MNLDDTEAQAQLRAEAFVWLAERMPLASSTDHSPGYFDSREDDSYVPAARAWQREKAAAGWVCLSWPERFGGRGLSVVEDLVFEQEEAKFETPVRIFGSGTSIVGPIIMSRGSAGQRERFLPGIRSGEDIWCQMLSEPAA